MTIDEYGVFSIDYTDAESFVLTAFDDAGLDYHAVGFSDTVIGGVMQKVFEYMFYSGFTFYEGDDVIETLYDAGTPTDVAQIVTGSINAEYLDSSSADGWSTDDTTTIVAALGSDWIYDQAVLAMNAYGYNADCDCYISNRDDIRSAVYTQIAAAGLNANGFGITDADIDFVIDDTVNYLIEGPIDSWSTEKVLERMTEVIQMTLTYDELLYIITDESASYETVMYDAPAEYYAWLETNYAQKNIFVDAHYDDLITILGVSDESELPQVWQDFFDIKLTDLLEMTGKEQKKYDAVANLEADHEADASYHRFEALRDFIDEIFENRVGRGVETDDSSLSAYELPADYTTCDEDRILLIEDLGRDLYYYEHAGMQNARTTDFLARIESWIVATSEADA